MKYLFHPAAEFEYLESIAYLESQQAGLGASFLQIFEEKMNHIMANPLLYPIEEFPDIRRALMDRFPYSILYRIREEVVQVLAVAHFRRRPIYWLGRIL